MIAGRMLDIEIPKMVLPQIAGPLATRRLTEKAFRANAAVRTNLLPGLPAKLPCSSPCRFRREPAKILA